MKVSIITVCYNSEKFIATAIDSVLSQKYKNIEYIVIDGLSDDSTTQIVQSYGNMINFVSESDEGIYDAMNKGLKLASGDVIGILNSDDFYPNTDVILNVVSHFKENPTIDMVIGNVDFVLPINLSKPTRFYSSLNFRPWKMRFGFMPAHPATFIKKKSYAKVGNYKLGYKIAADFDWFIRAFFLHKLSYVTLNHTLVRMREGGVSTSGFKSYIVTSKEQLKAICSNGFYSNIFFVLLRLPIKMWHKIYRKKS